MNLKILSKSIEAGIKQQMVKLADEYDTNVPKPITEAEYDNGMYEDACRNCIKRINAVYKELKADVKFTFVPLQNCYEIKNQERTLKSCKSLENLWYYLEGVLYAIEEQRCKVNVCKRCGEIFTNDLKYCPNPECRTPYWNRIARKYTQRKARLINNKKKRGVKNANKAV
jgi:hypothetical protein